MLPMMPTFTIGSVRRQLYTSVPTATAAINELETLGIVKESTGLKKNRRYSYQAYIDLLSN
jgi:Fic family protein